MMDMKEQFQAMPTRYPELRGQVAVITGGAKGIGLGIVMRLAREGMRIVIADIDRQSLTAAVSTLHELGVEAFAFEGDVSQTEVIGNLFEKTIANFHTVHLLVNNAADLSRQRLLDEHEALLDHQLANNIRGPYLCSYQAARIMYEGGGGSIIHLSSVGALRAHMSPFPYDVTKGAINAMTRAMAIDLAEYNIRVNALAPGVTQKNRSRTPNKEITSRIPLQRAGSLEELSATVAFLASPDAGYITGQVIYVDGGITAQLSPPGQLL